MISSESAGKIGKGKPPVETRFKPGESGNPKGREEGSKNRGTVLRQLLAVHLKHKDLEGNETTMTAEQRMLQALVQKAFDGDVSAVREALDSVYGKADQKHILAGDEEKPVRFILDPKFKDE